MIKQKQKHENRTSTDGWELVYKRTVFDRCMACLQAIGMVCFAILFIGYLLFEAASLSGIRGLSPPAWNIAKTDTLANKAYYLLCLLAGGWLAYSSVRSLAKIIKDLFTWNRKYEGVLKKAEEKSYSGLRINYRMLALECTDATWEIFPRLKNRYLLRPGRKIRVFFTGGTKTIKTLWILK